MFNGRIRGPVTGIEYRVRRNTRAIVVDRRDARRMLKDLDGDGNPLWTLVKWGKR